ncbi:MAG: serine/threonine-protein kinase [Marinicella sp.]
MNDMEKLLSEAEQLALGETVQPHHFIAQSSQKISDSFRKIQRVKLAFEHNRSFTDIDLSGSVWDRLEVIQCIGSGGVGAVYQAFDPVLDRHVALKILHPFSSHYISPEKFVGEAKRMAQVRHPHIMAVYGAGFDQGFAGYWGELLKGKNLSEYLTNHPEMTIEDKLNLAIQLAEAVAAVHNKQLAHGDIKNLNIMVEDERGVVLMDFGTSVKQDGSATTNLQPLTPLAMAPEQFQGAQPSQMADVFSLGVVLYYLFNQKYPFQAADFATLKSSVLSEQVEPFTLPSVYGKKIRSLIMAMLTPDPQQRPDIHQIHSSLQEIERIPANRNKKQKIGLAFLLLFSITALSWYNTYQTKLANQKLVQSQTETEAVNEILNDIIRSPSSIEMGENILMKDVVLQKINEVQNNAAVSDAVKNRIYYSFAHSLDSLGEYTKQAELLQAIIDNPNSKSSYTISALIRIADIKMAQNSLDEAAQLLAQAEKHDTTVLDQQKRIKIRLYDAFTSLHLQQQAFDLAKQYNQKSVQMWENEAINFDASVTFQNQGQIHIELSEFKAAIPPLQRCVEIAESFRGTANWNAIGCHLILSRVYATLGEFDQAITTYERILPIANQYLGNDSVQLFQVRINYASVLSHSGKLEQSLQVNEENLADAIKYDMPMAIRLFIQNNLASGYINFGRYEQAEQATKELIPALIEHYSATHESTFQAQSSLAEIYHKTGRPEVAIELLQTQIPLALASIGDNHLATLEMQGSLAWSYHLIGRNDLAQPLIESVLERKTRVYGADHPITKQAQQRLAQIAPLNTQ